MIKSDIRKLYVEKRRLLSTDEIDKFSRDICNRCIENIDLSSVSSLHIFLPILDKKELNTNYIIEQLRELYSKITIVVPKTDFASSYMTNIVYDANTKLENNKWNIPEPINGIEFPSKSIDLVFMPLLAFDKVGNRVGYGKGFYDRFLTNCRNDVAKIGLSIFEPIEGLIEDINQYDQKMDMCITPTNAYRF